MYKELSCDRYCLNTKNKPNYTKSMSSITSSLVEVHIVHKGNEHYAKGRKLAETVYRQVWGTENLLDGNDYGVIVSQNGKVLGNINIQFRRSRELLKSEVFFGERHWQEYSDTHHSQIAEISALAIAQDAPKQLRRSIMMTLILGIHLICCVQNVNFLVTVQHDYLIRILNKSLRLPFFPNQIQLNTQGKVPQDNYWKRAKLPRLYYLFPNNLRTIGACASYLNRIPTSKIETFALPMVEAVNLSYSTSPQNWKKIRNEPKVHPQQSIYNNNNEHFRCIPV